MWNWGAQVVMNRCQMSDVAAVLLRIVQSYLRHPLIRVSLRFKSLRNLQPATCLFAPCGCPATTPTFHPLLIVDCCSFISLYNPSLI